MPELDASTLVLGTIFGAVGLGYFVYGKRQGEADHRARVLRCRFDGVTLRLVEAGPELAVKGGRGLGEPSLARFGGHSVHASAPWLAYR